MSAGGEPRLFRVILQVGDLDEAAAFYTALLGVEGRHVGGGRCYFDAGGVILALLDPGADAPPQANVEDVYFAVDDLDALHARARTLRGLSSGTVHGEPAGEIVVRPWGERSFYARDPWGNHLCFVDSRTLFTGR